MRRHFHALTAAGAAAHHAFELIAGTGLVFQPDLGLRGAGLLWGAGIPAWFVVAARGSSRWDRLLAFAAGMSLGAVVLHFRLWPWRTRDGLPLLQEAEGLRPEQLPAYNAVLYGWAVPAAVALARETGPRIRPWGALGFAVAMTFRGRAAHHFTWVREQAHTNPAWWNRALRS